MANDEEPVHLDGEEASAGTKPGVMRYVLGVSMLLVIVIFFILLLRPFG